MMSLPNVLDAAIGLTCHKCK